MGQQASKEACNKHDTLLRLTEALTPGARKISQKHFKDPDTGS